MPGDKGFGWLHHWIRYKYLGVLTLVLVVQATLFYAASRAEKVHEGKQLTFFPAQIQNWQMVQDAPIEQEVLDQLKADDTLNRMLRGDPRGRRAAADQDQPLRGLARR